MGEVQVLAIFGPVEGNWEPKDGGAGIDVEGVFDGPRKGAICPKDIKSYKLVLTFEDNVRLRNPEPIGGSRRVDKKGV